MKKLFLVILVLLALFTGVACLDITPYPIVDAPEADAGEDGG